MRNTTNTCYHRPPTGSVVTGAMTLLKTSLLLSSLLLAVPIVGCGDSHPDRGPAPTLVSANQALAEHAPDRAIADAGTYLRGDPYGPEAAVALYIQGRGYESKQAANPAERRSNLDAARSAYLQAMSRSPETTLEGSIHASLSNVAFFQDDFPTSIEQATAAMPMVKSADLRRDLLFRIGVCQQRLRRFTDADQTYRQVEQRYPNTPVAAAARRREGLKTFTVQLGVYENNTVADQATARAFDNGIGFNRVSDNQGHVTISNGPYTTYAEARRILDQLTNFPKAEIVP